MYSSDDLESSLKSDNALHKSIDATVDAVAKVMKQLGDPSRLKIFIILCHAEKCVSEIAEATQMTSPAVSHHLRILKVAGVIKSRRSGKEMYYKVSDSKLATKIHETIEDIAEISCSSRK